MSRTYRKNPRWYCKFRGEFCNNYTDNTVKGKPRHYADSNDWTAREYWGASHFRTEVLVGDSGNFTRSAGKAWKQMCHRIDRARFKQALYYNEDAHIKTSMDPYDWID